MSIFHRVTETGRPLIKLEIDGHGVSALAGDTVLTAALTNGDLVRVNEFDGGARAGFCLIGACQDCWMRDEEGLPVRACTTLAEEGMRLLTRWNPRQEWSAGAEIESATAKTAGAADTAGSAATSLASLASLASSAAVTAVTAVAAAGPGKERDE